MYDLECFGIEIAGKSEHYAEISVLLNADESEADVFGADVVAESPYSVKGETRLKSALNDIFSGIVHIFRYF